MKRQFVLRNDPHARAIMANTWGIVQSILASDKNAVVTVAEETRTLAQNRLMWEMLDEVSQQVDWYGKKLTTHAWKCVFSASLKKQDVVPGLHGDFVVIGESTSNMTVREMTDLIELMSAFGAEKGVRFKAHEAVAA